VAERETGNGVCVYVMTFAEEPFYCDLFDELIGRSGIRRILDVPVPAGTEVTERTSPDSDRLVFVINSAGQEVRIPMPQPGRDIWEEEDLGENALLSPFGTRILAF